MRDKIENVIIRGVAACLPGKVESLDSLYAGCTDADTVEQLRRTAARFPGLGGRHRVGPETTAMDLANRAGRILLEKLDWDPKSVDAVVTSTVAPDELVPSAGYRAHKLLGLSRDCVAVDATLTCNASLNTIWLTGGMMRGGAVRRALILLGDALSGDLAPNDLLSRAMFGDAGCAVALEYCVDAAPMAFLFRTDTTGIDALTVLGRGYRPNRESPYFFTENLRMATYFYSKLPAHIQELCEYSGHPLASLDRYYLHQPNQFMLSALVGKLKLPEEKTPVAVFGNCGGSTIPLMLCDTWKRSADDKPLSALLCGFGAGYSWSAAHIVLAGLVVPPVAIASDL